MKKIKFLLIIFLLLLTGCKPKEYTITFNTNGGTKLETIKVKEGDTLESVKTPKKEGYIFVSWEKDGIKYSQNNPINEDLNLTAVWTEAPDLSKEYNVIFSYPDKEETTKVQGKSKAIKPKDPTIKYYNFIGWYLEDKLYDFDTPVTKDLFLVAKFEHKIVTIKFDLEGGSGIAERQIEAGKKLQEPDKPTKFGYNFTGWYLLGKEYNFDSVIKDITLVAKWEAISYVTVRFNTQSEEIKSQVIEAGGKAKRPNNPVKEGYTFKYWEYNNLEFDFDTPIEKNITLNAVFEENEKVEIN